MRPHGARVILFLHPKQQAVKTNSIIGKILPSLPHPHNPELVHRDIATKLFSRVELSYTYGIHVLMSLR